MRLRRAVDKVTPPGWTKQMGFEDSSWWVGPNGEVAEAPPDYFQMQEWDDDNPTRRRSATATADGRVTGAFGPWSASVARGGDGGFFSETFGGTLDGAREFATSPEMAMFLAATGAAGGFGGTGGGTPGYFGGEIPELSITDVGGGMEIPWGEEGMLEAWNFPYEPPVPWGEEGMLEAGSGWEFPYESSVPWGEEGMLEAGGGWKFPASGGASTLTNILRAAGLLRGGADGGGAAGDTSSIGRLLGLGSQGSALTDLIGKGASTALGMYAADKKAEALKRMADDSMTRWNQSMAIGAPSRDRYEGSFAPGFTMDKDPGYTDALNQTAKATTHALSIGGSPAGSPNAWAATLKDLYDKTTYPALQGYRTTNANTGGYGSFAAAGARGPDTDAAMGVLNADDQFYGSLGAGIADATTPRSSIEALLKRMNGGNDIFKVG